MRERERELETERERESKRESSDMGSNLIALVLSQLIRFGQVF